MEHVSIDQTDAVALVTVTRPKVLNALNLATVDELHEAFGGLRDDASVRGVILTGAGDRAFIAGRRYLGALADEPDLGSRGRSARASVV